MRKALALSSKDRLELIGRLQAHKLADKDYLVLTEVLRHGLISLEKLERRERDEARQQRVGGEGEGGDEPTPEPETDTVGAPKKVKGHGRLGEKDYAGATTVNIAHEHLHVGDRCPDCGRGRLYELEPGKRLTLMASAPVDAVRFLLQKMRCSGCMRIFGAKAPPEAGYGKYHPSANAAVALTKYGLGVPFKRLEHWQRCLGIPLPDATQWGMAETVADCLYKTFLAMEDQAADASLFHTDDTNMPIVSMILENKTLGEKDRYGMHASGILARKGAVDIYLYYLGRRHCGENLGRLLDKRSPGLPVPLQMGDASSCNTKHHHQSAMCFCSAHAVRNFKGTHSAYPDYAGHILALLKTVYENEAHTKKEGMTDDQRLAYHRAHSASPMKQLRTFLDQLLAEHMVEPNSNLGKAIVYMTKRWQGFTRFLEIPGVPLDNNILERALKQVIRLRKNAGFLKNDHGAQIASIIFSMLATAIAAGVNPMDYFVAVQVHREDAHQNPSAWFPWNYRDRLDQLAVA